MQGSFSMNYEIIVKPAFQREAKRMAKHYASFKEGFALLIDDLEKNPQLGTDLGHGLRKVRMKNCGIIHRSFYNFLYTFSKVKE